MKRLAIVLVFGLGTGLASKQAFMFTSKDVAKVYINPKKCSVLENGDLDCSHVRVVLATVPAESLKQ